MSQETRLTARLANWLIAHAEHFLPASRREWGQAMQREFEEIHSPYRALRWALGCVFASYTERFNAMNRADLRVSNWILACESLTCFLPLTLLWIACIFNMSKLSSEPGMLFAVALSTIAPLSLLLSLIFVTSGRRPNYKWHTAFACGFVLLGILQIAKITTQGPRFSWSDVDGGLMLLLWILPALCSLHLAHLARCNPTS